MREPLVSIIVPVYNVEQYLRRCLDSVLAQTYSNWECICVNDGSPDGSAAILAEYSSKDERFRILDRENGGLSAARNTALDAMAGEYMIFIDSDDFIHPQLLEITVYQALRDQSDLVVFRYDHFYRNFTKFTHFIGLPDIKPCFRRYVREQVPYLVTDNIYAYATDDSHKRHEGIDNRYRVKHCQVWRNLYRTSVVEGIRFYPGINYEDLPWWGSVLLRLKKVTINNLPLYYYYPNKSSFLLSSNDRKKIRHLKAAISVAEKVYENAGTEEQKRIWDERFITPFKRRLARKQRKYGDVE